MEKSERRKVRIKLTVRVLAALGCITIIIGLFFRIFGVSNSAKVKDIEVSLQHIRASLNADTIRQFHLQKIMKIIDMYNPDMASNKQYEIANEILSMSIQYTNIDVELLCALITQESRGTWDPQIITETGGMGLMQVMPAIGMYIAKYEDISWQSAEEVLLDPTYNIRLGARYFSTLIDYYDIDGGLVAYNAGIKTASQWLRSGRSTEILPNATRTFLPEVMKLYRDFKEIKMP